MEVSEALLRAILATVGRETFRPAEVVRIVCPNSGGKKQIQAYNLCDGRTPQSEIGKRLKLDKGSLSRSISRWIEAGIVFRVGPEELPLHLYPVSEADLRLARGVIRE
jgi:hypothetical protein